MDGVSLSDGTGRGKRDLFGGEGLAREIIATRIKTSLHEARVKTEEVLHLHAPMRGVLRAVFSHTCFFSMTFVM